MEALEDLARNGVIDMGNRFGREGCFKCSICGKRSRDTGNGETDIVGYPLCKKCLMDSEWENSHIDNCGLDVPKEDCPNGS